jgi:hypothetical protein
MVDEREALAVEARCGEACRDRHPHGIAQALPQRARRRLDAAGQLVFRVARRLRAELPEVLELLHRQAVAGQVEQRVEERRGVAAGEDEAVAVRPVRVVRVVAHVPRPQEIGERRLAERRAGMARLRLLDHVHGQETDGVDRRLRR